MAFGVDEGSEMRRQTVSDVPAVSCRPVSDSCDSDASAPIWVPAEYVEAAHASAVAVFHDSTRNASTSGAPEPVGREAVNA